jgi:lysophospholipase L1-like esterase
LVGIVAGLWTTGVSALAGPPPVTLGIVSTGDSITRAFNVDWCCYLRDNPQFSWSTGDDPTVTSMYQDLVTVDSRFAGHTLNLAVTGAKAADLSAQLTQAAQSHLILATTLIGGNDLCAPTAAQMTDVTVFRTQMATALAGYFAANPGGFLFLTSIPDLYQLWSVGHTNAWATLLWGLFNVCQSMLAAANSEADRQLVVAREAAYNQGLAQVCAAQPQCLWDRMAVFNTKFTVADASTVDFFHPSVVGQNHLALTAAIALAKDVSGTVAAAPLAG